MRPLGMAFLCVTAPLLSGCCSIARAWCGPDKAPWVSVDFRTPELATRTLLEALRRDEPQVVYDALSDELRAELGVDGMGIELAWPKIKQQHPYLHVAGYAKVISLRGPGRDDLDRQTVTLELEGQGLQLDLVRQAYWELRYQRPGLDLSPQQRDARVGRRLDAVANAVNIERSADVDRSLVKLLPQPAAHYGVDAIPVANVESVSVYHAWKVSKFTFGVPLPH